MDLLNRIAAELLEKEVINGPELDELIGGAAPGVANPPGEQAPAAV